MLIRRQDLLVLSFNYIGYSVIRNRIVRLQGKPLTRFLTFHDILPDAFGTFRAKLHFLKDRTNVVSLNDFFSGRISVEKINTVITFDDGYKSWIEFAMPTLKELGLTATFFVSSGFIGLTKKKESEFAMCRLFRKLGPRKISGCLSFDDMKMLSGEGFTLGGHTVNHCNLSELQDLKEVQYEISEDKERLEAITGRKVNYFSYPGGDYNNPVINIADVLKNAGYIGAVTTVPGFNNAGTNQYLLNRELTSASMSETVFKARVYGNSDGVRIAKQQIELIFKNKRNLFFFDYFRKN